MNSNRLNLTNRSQSGGGKIASLTALSVSLIAGLVFSRYVAQADSPGVVHYPDLQPYPAYQLSVKYDSSRSHRFLAFSTAIGNFGEGPVELFPVNNEAAGTTDAYQRLYTHDASGSWYPVATNFVGTFEFHAAHDHWHFNNFAAYELRNVGPNGSIGTTVLASAQKVSFCLEDSWQETRLSFDHVASQTYVNCCQDCVQGISVSWADVYPSYLEGQSLDITGLPDGTYWLLITVDPGDVISEGGGVKSNNVSATKFQINKGSKTRILQYGQ